MSENDNRKAAVKKIKLLVYNQKMNMNVYRQKIDDAYTVPILPNKVELSEHNYGGVVCDVFSPEIYSSKRVTFYIHGGCFVGGSRAAYRSFCAMIANKTFSRVVVPEYRLAPVTPFPSAIEDIQSVLRSLFTEEQIDRSLDSEVPEFVIAADGAGASIALALLLNLKDKFRKCIKKVVLFSPWLNVSDSSALFTGKKKMSDEILSSDVIQQCTSLYTYESNFKNPLVSPALASSDLLEGFPPVYIQCGGKEILLNDIRSFEDLLKNNNVECKVDVWSDMMHLFQLADDLLEDAHHAFERLAAEISGIDNENIERQTYENKPRLEDSLKRTEA